jgi:hypothetical protein
MAASINPVLISKVTFFAMLLFKIPVDLIPEIKAPTN